MPLKDFKPRSPDLFRSRVGARIREVRGTLNLSQRELASLCGLPPDRLAKYELGIHPPPLYALTRVAEALGRPVDVLLPELHLRGEVDRDLYRVCRELWRFPEDFRGRCAQMLRIMIASWTDLSRLQPSTEGRHASSRR